MTSAIDPNHISDGEQVIIQDADRNLIEGPASFDEKGRLTVHAFGTEIVFAAWRAQGRGGLGGYSPVKGIKIVGHQPPIDALAFDTVPKQKYGRNPT